MAEHQALLNAFGFNLQQNGELLTIKSIPIVLAQLDLKTMIASVIAAVSSQTIDANLLSQHLLDLLQTTDSIQFQQVEEWLRNASPQQCIHQPWCQELDLVTLGSLFSD